MRTGILLCLFFLFCLISTTSFKAKEAAVDDKTLLDIMANQNKLPLFNYTVKMAAVDTRLYNPNYPVVYPPTTIFKSRCTDSTAHGGMIFRLRAKDDSNYAYDLTQPDGQTLVMATYYYTQSNHTLGDGKSLRLSDSLHLLPAGQGNYYLMYKNSSANYPTDSGWIYAVVAPDGQKILQKGLIVNCMGCHSESKTDRMLGAK